MRAPDFGQNQVAPGDMPGVRVQPVSDAAGLEALGEGIERAGQGIDSGVTQVMRAKKRADAITAANAITQLKHDTTSALYGPDTAGGDATAPTSSDPAQATAGPDGTAPSASYAPTQKAADAAFDGTSGLSQKGLLNERGMDASRYAHPTMQWLSGRADEIEQDLPNDDAKALFRKMAMGHLEDTRQVVLRHRGQQIQAAGEDSKQATMAIGLQTLGRDITAPGATYDDIVGSLDRTTAAGETAIKAIEDGPKGVEQSAAYKEQATANVLQHFIDAKDAKGAAMFYAARRADLGTKADAFGHVVTTLTGQVEAEQLGHDLVTGTVKDGGLHDLPQAVTKFEALPTEQRTPQAEEAFQKHYRLAAEEDRGKVSNAFSTAMSDWIPNHSLSDVQPQTKAWMQANDPEGWHRLEQMDASWRASQQPRGGRKSNEVTSADIATGKLLADMAAHSEKYDPKQGGMSFDEFARGFAAPLGKEGYEAASKKYAEIQAAAAKGDKDTKVPVTAQRVILELGHGKIWDKEQPEKMDDDSAAAFRSMSDSAERFRRDFKASHKGEEPTTEEYEKALAPQMRSVPVPGMLWGSNDIPLVQYETAGKYRGEGGKLTPLKVPDDFVQALKARKGGADISPDQASAYYLEYLKAGGGGVAPAKPAAPSPQGQNDRFKYDHPDVQRVLTGSITQGMPSLHASLRPPEKTAPEPKKKSAPPAKARTASPLPDEDQQALDETAQLTKDMGT
ncbi:MAG: hypothetical protein JST54_12510 [Deltaproteobacteria bacterium]|nr:hypothetical protein [Deltaproteobacteria bacterium]